MDFEAMIREARNIGTSIDDIAKIFSKTLNAIQQEEQKQNSVANERKAKLDYLKNTFHGNITKDQLNCANAAVLFTIAMAEKYTNWTAKNIEEFLDAIQETARTTAELIGKSSEEILRIAFGKSKDDDDKIAEFLKFLES